MKKRILAMILCIALCFSMVTVLSGCGGSGSADAFVIMTEQLDGLFNPFFYTAAADGTIVGMTQIGMLGSKYENGEILPSTDNLLTLATYYNTSTDFLLDLTDEKTPYPPKKV